MWQPAWTRDGGPAECSVGCCFFCYNGDHNPTLRLPLGNGRTVKVAMCRRCYKALKKNSQPFAKTWAQYLAIEAKEIADAAPNN